METSPIRHGATGPSGSAWRLDIGEPTVGSRNLRRRQIRLRRGSTAAALRRLGVGPARRPLGLQDVIDLVSIRPLHPPEVTLVPGVVSRVVADEHRIELAADTSPYDLAFAYAHELGHLFDASMLEDGHRQVFSDAVATGSPWNGGRYQDNIEEAWATAFAVVACAGPWRCTLWAPSNWPEARTPAVLDSCRRLVEATAGARSSRSTTS